MSYNYVEQFNVVVTQKSFNDSYTVEDWLLDCSICAGDTHNVNEPIPHDCYMCAEFAPVEKVFPFHGLSILLFVVFLGVVIYKVTKK